MTDQYSQSSKLTKALLALTLGASLITSAPLSASAAGSNVTLTVNGHQQSHAQSPLLIEDRVYVPVRALLESLGFEIKWDPKSQLVFGFRGDHGDEYIQISLKDNTLMFQDPLQQQHAKEIRIKVIDGRTMVTARSLSEAMGMDITWNAHTQTLNIDTKKLGLFEALIHQDVFTVRSLVQKGVDPNTKKGGLSALRYAVEFRDLASAKVLVEHGAVADELLTAVANNDADMLNFLLPKSRETKSEAEIANQYLASAAKFGSPESVMALLAFGADPNRFDPSAMISPHQALGIAVQTKDTEIFKALLAAGADPNSKTLPTDQYDTILIHTVGAGNLEMTKLLLEAKADPNVRSTKNWTPLMIAADQGNALLVNLLLKHGADVNASNEGATALAIARAHGNTETAEALVTAGAMEIPPVELPRELLFRDPEVGKTLQLEPLEEAAWLGDTHKVDQMLKTKMQLPVMSAWEAAINHGNLETAKAILNRRPDLLNDSIIGSVLQTGNPEVLKMIATNEELLKGHLDTLLAEVLVMSGDNVLFYQALLDLGFNPNGEFDEHTPLVAAARRGYPEVAKILLQAGADVNEINHHGETALNVAIGHGHLETVKVLLTAKDLSSEIISDALIAAVKRDNLELAARLLEAGADVNFQTSTGDSPLLAAEAVDNPKMIELLSKAQSKK